MKNNLGAINIQHILTAQGLLSKSDLTINDYIIIAKKVNNRRDGTEYQYSLIPATEVGSGNPLCDIVLQEIYNLDPTTTTTYLHPSGSGIGSFDPISPGINITRDVAGPLFNTPTDIGPSGSSPSGTEWSFDISNITDPSNRTFDVMQVAVINAIFDFSSLPGTTWMMHDTINNRYFLIEFLTWQPGASGGAFSYIRTEIVQECSGCITFPDGTTQCTSATPLVIQDEGVPLPSQPIMDFQGGGVTVTNGFGKTIVTIPLGGASAINVGKAIFVDNNTGNDGTALPYRFDFMYATYAAAKAVAAAGDTIIMYPGSYIVNNMQFDGGRVYAYPGVVLTGSTIVGDSGMTKGQTFSLLGFATIQSNGYALQFQASGNINIEFDSCNTSGSATIWYQKAADTVTIRGNYISGNNSTVYAFGSNKVAKFIAYVKHWDNKSNNAFESNFYSAVAFGGDFEWHAERITMTGVKGGSIGGNMIQMQNDAGNHDIRIYTDEIIDIAPAGFSVLLQGTGGTGVISITTGNYNGPSVLYSNGGNQKCNFICDTALCNWQYIALIASSYNVYMEGSYKVVQNAGVGVGMIYNSGGRIRLKNFDAEQLGNGAGYQQIGGSGAKLIVDDATFVLNSVDSGFTCNLNETIVVNGFATTNGAIVNLTNAVTGTLFITDGAIEL